MSRRTIKCCFLSFFFFFSWLKGSCQPRRTVGMKLAREGDLKTHERPLFERAFAENVMSPGTYVTFWYGREPERMFFCLFWFAFLSRRSLLLTKKARGTRDKNVSTYIFWACLISERAMEVLTCISYRY